MEFVFRCSLLLGCLQAAHFTESGARVHESRDSMQPECVINLQCQQVVPASRKPCEECLPDNMPLVTSQRAHNGSVSFRDGDEVTLSCGGGRFLAYPLRETVIARCRNGAYLVSGQQHSLLELGCQENVFEDALHALAYCSDGLQSRVYRRQDKHLAAMCYDSDRALPLRATVTSNNELPMPPHTDNKAPLTLFGNLNQMFDARARRAAERLLDDPMRLHRRLIQLIRPHHVTLAGHTLAAVPLLAPKYFHDQNMRVTEFASNKIVVWRSVAEGNLRHAQHDAAKLMQRASLTVHTGTHGVAAIRTNDGALPLYLQPPTRFPVARYIWTVIVDPVGKRALALVVLNEPLVSVSDIRASVFCESACQRAVWARQLTRQRRYETPALGLAFCCDVHSFAQRVTELPKQFIADIPHGDAGMLLDDYDTKDNEL